MFHDPGKRQRTGAEVMRLFVLVIAAPLLAAFVLAWLIVGPMVRTPRTHLDN